MNEPASSGMIAVQAGAATVVGEVLTGKNLDRVLDRFVARHQKLSPNERSAIQSIAFDTLRFYGLLSAQLDTLLKQPPSDQPVRNLLLVALSQLQFSKSAAHAIVDHAVNACAEIGFARAKPLVNAVLRNYLRAPENFGREALKTEQAAYDFPPWWITRMRSEYPLHWESVLKSAALRPPMWLRVNRRKGNAEQYLAELAKVGIAATGSDGAVRLERPVPVGELPGFREGFVSVQDIGAQAAARLLAPANGQRVLDACAAPGGKTGHLLEIADVRLTAIDQDAHRLIRVSENLKRLGLVADVRAADASKPETWWDGVAFDRILLDVPCSGSGVVRRHPDIKWIRREADIHAFARQQSRLLLALWNCLAIGGRLLYATCSTFRAENHDIVEQFIRKTPNARLLSVNSGPSEASGRIHALTAEIPDGLLLPDDVHDGFYYALLERAA